jgi:ABC-type Na+ efflux pump permease subunit
VNRRVVWAIARKDLREVLANRLAWMPALVLPTVLCVVVPTLVIGLPQWLPALPASSVEPPWMKPVLALLPKDLATAIAGLPAAQQAGLVVAAQLLAPMFLIIPLMLASIVGANAFVGEKERKTLEALLYTPATDAEIFLGKTLAALLPAVVLAWGSFVAYTLVVNAVAWPLLGRVWFPTPPWWPLIFWVTPAVAGLGLIVTVLVSSRVSNFLEANQISGALVLPLVVLMASQAAGAVMLTVPIGLLIGGVVWLLDAGLLVLAIRSVRRASLITRL